MIKIITCPAAMVPAFKAEATFDVRYVDNPYLVKELSGLTGLDSRVQGYVLSRAPMIISAIEAAIYALDVEGGIKDHTVIIYCLGGIHRSVAIAEIVAREFRDSYPSLNIVLEHVGLNLKGGA